MALRTRLRSEDRRPIAPMDLIGGDESLRVFVAAAFRPPSLVSPRRGTTRRALSPVSCPDFSRQCLLGVYPDLSRHFGMVFIGPPSSTKTSPPAASSLGRNSAPHERRAVLQVGIVIPRWKEVPNHQTIPREKAARYRKDLPLNTPASHSLK